uniref:Uncharacterized protein n=1 Tax=Anguilla anguilla TaxID=7936 RepID=A0A0E9XEN9_ANGAN
MADRFVLYNPYLIIIIHFICKAPFPYSNHGHDPNKKNSQAHICIVKKKNK